MEARDVLFYQVAEFVIKNQKASASLIQRTFNLGYARSAMLLDELENAGVIGEVRGANPRLILIDNVDNIDKGRLPKEMNIEDVTPKLKWNKTVKPTKGFVLNVGRDEKGDDVSVDLEKYGNLLLVGSQMTNVSDLINQIILNQVKTKSPDELKLIVIDGFINQVTIPNNAPHLLTPIVTDTMKIDSALKWLHSEINRRSQANYNEKNPAKILLIIHGFNETIYYTPNDVEERLALILSIAKSTGIFVIITADYIDSKLNKWIIANIGAKIVFRPTTKQTARASGIPESIKLVSPDQAILQTMFEGKNKFVMDKVDVEKGYREVFK